MKQLYKKVLPFIFLSLIGISSQAQKILDYSFVTVGCNRVDDVDSTANKPSTANVYQLNRMFTEVSQLSPLPQYLFFTGDLVIGYAKDTIRLANQLKAWVALYKAHPLSKTSVKLVVIPGNHETQDKAAGKLSFVAAERTFVREMSAFILGNNGPTVTGLVAGSDSLTTDQSRLSYSFNYKTDHFVMLNTDPVGRDWKVPTNWINTDITAAKANGARHTFVFGHKPAYASTLKPTDGLVYKNPALRDVFWNTLEMNNCEAMFAAHNHLWEKQQPHANKTWQIIAGNGGSNLESSTAAANRYFGYTLVNVFTNGEVVVESYGRDLDAANYITQTPNNPTTLRVSQNINLTPVTTDIVDNAVTTNSLMIIPNPMVGNTEIKINVFETGDVKVEFYDMQGKSIYTVIDSKLNSGSYTYQITTHSLHSGTYNVVMVCNGKKISQKAIVIK